MTAPAARWKSVESYEAFLTDLAGDAETSAIYDAMTELRANPNPRRRRYLTERLAALSGEES